MLSIHGISLGYLPQIQPLQGNMLSRKKVSILNLARNWNKNKQTPNCLLRPRRTRQTACGNLRVRRRHISTTRDENETTSATLVYLLPRGLEGGHTRTELRLQHSAPTTKVNSHHCSAVQQRRSNCEDSASDCEDYETRGEQSSWCGKSCDTDVCKWHKALSEQ